MARAQISREDRATFSQLAKTRAERFLSNYQKVNPKIILVEGLNMEEQRHKREPVSCVTSGYLCESDTDPEPTLNETVWGYASFTPANMSETKSPALVMDHTDALEVSLTKLAAFLLRGVTLPNMAVFVSTPPVVELIEVRPGETASSPPAVLLVFKFYYEMYRASS